MRHINQKGSDRVNHYGHMIRVLHRGISQAVTGAMAQMELTSAQGRIMGFLAMCKSPPCAKDIEEKFHLSHPTVFGLLARLEKKDFIEFRPDEQDRRCKRIYMLPKGADCNEQIYHAIEENERRIVADFSEEEKALFADFLIRAAKNMGCDPQFHFEQEEPKE